ncbi:CHASE2 domain-containing protein [Acidobacteriota bacterium]
MKNKLVRGIGVGLSVFVLSLILYHLNVFRSSEWKSWDLRLRLFSQSSRASKDIVLFLIDQESLDVYEKEQGLPWPWPRQLHSAIIRYCMEGGAKAVFFDLMFSETSIYGVEDDKDLAETMALAGNVFLPVFLSRSVQSSEEIPVQILNKHFLSGAEFSPKAVYPMQSVTLPIENLLQSARGVGNVNFSPDKDGIYRRLPLLFFLQNSILPSIPWAMAEVIKGEPSPLSVPLDRSGRMVIRYHGPTGTYRSFSAAAIINSFARLEEGETPQIPPERFSGKIVLVGASAPGLYDLRPSPFSAVFPGVEIQATVLDNLLHEDFIHVPSNMFAILFLGIFAFLCGIGSSLLGKVWKITLFFLLCLSLPAGIVCWAFFSGYWLDFIAPEFAVLMSFAVSTLLNYRIEGRQRRFIKNVFRHYLSHHVIDRIIKNPSLLRLGGEKREISSFFSDVADFTSISENLSPEDLVNLLNAFLSEMTNIILASGGTLDKYEGDAIIAFWNAPLDQPDHGLRACRAALKCQERLEEKRGDFRNRFGHELFMRVGVNSGPAVVGNMGSHNRFDYTAMGDTVNLASRLEGACKQYKVPILIGEATHTKIQDTIVSREVDLIRVVGKKKPVSVFEIIGEKNKVLPDIEKRIKTFHLGLEAFRNQQWDEAQDLFLKLGDDKLAQMYQERCKLLRKTVLPENWSGVFDLKEK